VPGNVGPAQAAGVGVVSGAETAPSFIARVAQLTGLDPKVVEAWVKAEGAYAPNGTGGYNFLNIRTSKSYSGVPLAGTTSNGFAQFYNANDAATETAHWINSMPNYSGIKAATKVGPKSQLAAIAGSPWDSGHYGGGRNLYNDYASITKGGGGIDWGSIAGGIANGITNPVGESASLIPKIPGVNDIPGVKTATTLLDAPSQIAGDISKVIGFVFNPADWLRIGYIIGGGVFVIGGLFILAKSVGATNVQGALGGSSGPAATAASVAGGPELAAAKLATQTERTKEVRARRRHHVERAKETRAQREERERKAYFRGAADAGR
jgi:hypothetical protein